jgi:Lon-like ATP-dependent protease
MLREEVVEAVRAGTFHIYPVRTVSEGIEMLTGVPAGTPGVDGEYPPETIFGRVDARLGAMTEALADLNAGSQPAAANGKARDAVA